MFNIFSKFYLRSYILMRIHVFENKFSPLPGFMTPLIKLYVQRVLLLRYLVKDTCIT